MGTTKRMGIREIAENTKATLCIDAELQDAKVRSPAKSCKFHSQLAIARANPRSNAPGPPLRASLIAAVTRFGACFIAEPRADSKTGTPNRAQ